MGRRAAGKSARLNDTRLFAASCGRGSQCDFSGAIWRPEWRALKPIALERCPQVICSMDSRELFSFASAKKWLPLHFREFARCVGQRLTCVLPASPPPRRPSEVAGRSSESEWLHCEALSVIPISAPANCNNNAAQLKRRSRMSSGALLSATAYLARASCSACCRLWKNIISIPSFGAQTAPLVVPPQPQPPCSSCLFCLFRFHSERVVCVKSMDFRLVASFLRACSHLPAYEEQENS